MKEHRSHKTNEPKAPVNEEVASLCDCLILDPCGCYVDPCNCFQTDSRGCYVDCGCSEKTRGLLKAHHYWPIAAYETCNEAVWRCHPWAEPSDDR